MSTYSARIAWQRAPDEDYARGRYSRRHALHFDGGAVVPGSSAPSSVPLPWSDPAAVDPEEMFVAALASCHMLWFLSLAAQAGHVVDRYEDDAAGTMTRNAEGRWAITEVVLRPAVAFAGGRAPDATQLDALHHRAHEACYIANSVRTGVRVEVQAPPSGA